VRSLRTALRRIQLLSAFFVFVCALVLALLPVLRHIKGFRITPGHECCMVDFGKTVYYPVRAFLDGANPYDRIHYIAQYPIAGQFSPYLPSTLLLHLPFGLMSQPVAAFWYLVSAVFLTVMLALLSLKFNGLKVSGAAVLLLASLIVLSRPGRQTLLLGQVTLQVVLASYVALYYARRVPRTSGLSLALTLFKPTYGLPLAAFMLIRGDKRAVGWGALFGLLLNLPVTAILARRAGGVGPFAEQLRATFGGFQTLPWTSPVFSQYRIDATALVGRFVGHAPDAAGQLLVTLVVLGLAAAALHLGWARRVGQEDFAFSAALVCTAVLLCGFHQQYDLLFLTLPFVAAARRCLPPRLNSPRLRWSLLVPFTFLAYDYAASDRALGRLGFGVLKGGQLLLSREFGALVLASLNGLALLTLFCGLVAAALDRRGGMSITLGGALQG
jgi:hypothetical protein